MLNNKVARLNLFFSKYRHIFRYFSSNRIMCIFFYFCTIFLILCLPYIFIFYFYLLLFLLLGDIFQRFDGALIHPILIGDIVEHIGNILIKLFINCLFVGSDNLINFCHQPVEQLHNKIVVVAILAIGEYDIAFLKEIILKCLSIVDWLYFLINCFVHIT